MTKKSNELGAIGATGRKATVVRRPLLVGVLAAGAIALGASTAVAVGPFGDSSGPSTMRGQGSTADMMKGGVGADMMG